MAPEAEGLSSSAYCREMGGGAGGAGLSARNFPHQCQEAGPGPRCSHGNHMRTESPPGLAWNLVWPLLHCGRTRANSYGTLVSGCLAPDSTPRSGRATFWPVGSSVHPPARPAELGPREQEQNPRLSLGSWEEGDGDLGGKALPGAGWAGQGGRCWAREGSLVLPNGLHADGSGMLQAGGGQAAGTPGWAGGVKMGTEKRQKQSQDLGPSCPEVLQRQPERIWFLRELGGLWPSERGRELPLASGSICLP